MSHQITTAMVQQFSANVEMLAQQMASRLVNTVRNEVQRGEVANYEQIGAVEPVKRVSRHADTPFTEVPHARRQVTMDDWELGEIVDTQDIDRVLIDPQSAYVRAFAAGMGRRMDRTILNAMVAPARTGKDGSTLVSLPASQVIAVDFVETGAPTPSSLTIAKLRRAKEVLDNNEAGVDPLEKRYIVCSSRERTALLRTVEVTSADFNTVRALVNGEVNEFMGFTFVTLPDSFFPVPATDTRTIMAYTSNGVLFARGSGPITNAAPDPTKGFNPRIHMKATFGATRMQETKVIDIRCSTVVF